MPIHLQHQLAPLAVAICMAVFGVVSGAAGADDLPEAIADLPEAIAAAVDHAARSAADRARDAGRKPGQVLDFVGIEPGMTVLDVFSSSGYYAEILSRVVGPEGRVIAHNNEAYMLFGGAAFKARYDDNRLPNVTHYLAEANDLDIGEGVADAAILILGFHDIYHFTGPKSAYVWPHIDSQRFLGNILGSLKPGGVLGIVDHAALAGAPRGTGDTLHRVDPAIVQEELAAAGFLFVGAADFLKNPEDPLDIPMSDPAIRGRTDRFVHLYRKPE